MTELGAKDPTSMVRWSVGGIFLEGLAARDFDRLRASLAPAVLLRALLPPGPASWEGAEAVAETFRSWFGGATDVELVDAIDLLCSGSPPRTTASGADGSAVRLNLRRDRRAGGGRGSG